MDNRTEKLDAVDELLDLADVMTARRVLVETRDGIQKLYRDRVTVAWVIGAGVANPFEVVIGSVFGEKPLRRYYDGPDTALAREREEFAVALEKYRAGTAVAFGPSVRKFPDEDVEHRRRLDEEAEAEKAKTFENDRAYDEHKALRAPDRDLEDRPRNRFA